LAGREECINFNYQTPICLIKDKSFNFIKKDNGELYLNKLVNCYIIKEIEKNITLLLYFKILKISGPI